MLRPFPMNEVPMFSLYNISSYRNDTSRVNTLLRTFRGYLNTFLAYFKVK
uniref:Uncharacterized protein n=1 Tax=Picea sitchensis TaxID=3332 RepID=A0A6B9XUX4_PICSI|nr:hypothetical protein Q903MT_gene3974 [Picea sitchensis]